MNIALVGYGKMGRIIKEVANERHHDIVAIIDVGNTEELDKLSQKNVDVAIEFSTPQTAFDNIKSCLNQGIPTISGTTGWLDRFEEIVDYCEKNNGAFLYASNFSLGVNLFFKMNRWLARIMKQHIDYKVSLEEIHHLQKLDKPSGTAISLAEHILNERKELDHWTIKHAANNELQITSIRENQVPGTHTISYDSPTDKIEIKHFAKSREGFATGAVLVSEWIVGKTGVLTMDDFLKFD